MIAAAAIACARAVSADDQRPGQAAAPVTQAPGRPNSVQVTLGGEWLLPDSLGTAPATMVQNSTGSSRYTYFTTSGTRAAAPAFRGGIAYVVTPVITVEAGMLISRGDVRGSIASDTEGVEATVVSGRLTQYFFDASVLAHLEQLRFAKGAGVPFVGAGAGYLRQLHEGSVAIDTGQIYHFGGGIEYLISTRPRSRLTGIGIRADARVYFRNKGYNFDNGQRAFTAVGGGVFLAF